MLHMHLDVMLRLLTLAELMGFCEVRTLSAHVGSIALPCLICYPCPPNARLRFVFCLHHEELTD